MNNNLKTTPLHGLHKELGGQMVSFAGYEMPVRYPLGILEEHRHTRAHAGLFDVSHMGQAFLKTDGDAAALLEEIVPGSLRSLKPGGMRYSVLLNDGGGILDDLMITRFRPDPETLYLVVNAACKDQDFAYIEDRLGGRAHLQRLEDRALLALQGPEAEAVLKDHVPGVEDLTFMKSDVFEADGDRLFISRSGYTGEDGFELSVPAESAEKWARRLLADERVEAIGLGARDSLRLEAGLCLYGHDIDETTSPVEGNIIFAVGKPRREKGDFPGGERIKKELEGGPARLRVGLRPKGRAPAREGTKILNSDGNEIGTVTSGGFGPTVGGPVAMGYVKADQAEAGTEVMLDIRGRLEPAEIVSMPFVKKDFKR